MITVDSGFVIYDETRNEFFCGLNTWDRQLRKAKVYHSERYLKQALESEQKNGRKLTTHIIDMRLRG